MRLDISWLSILCSPGLDLRAIRARSFYSGRCCWQSVAGAFSQRPARVAVSLAETV